MELKDVYSSESEIPEGLAGYFNKQADGSFKINLAGGVKTQADVDRAMGAMEKQKELRIEAEKKLSEFPKDFDAEKWETVKDIDPEKYTGGKDLDPESKEFQQAVSQAVREKEKELKKTLKAEYEQKEQELDQEKQATRQQIKDYRFKRDLADAGLTNPDMLDSLMLQIKHGTNHKYDELRSLYNTIEVSRGDKGFDFVGGDLKDPQGYKDVIDSFTKHEVTKNHKPAADNSGGGTPPSGGGGAPLGVKSKKDLSSVKEKTKFVSEHGLDAWKSLPNE